MTSVQLRIIGMFTGSRAGRATLTPAALTRSAVSRISSGVIAAPWAGRQVVHGADELPFCGGLGLAAHAQVADAHVVLDVAVRGLGDVAALAVGGDALFGFQ